MSFNISWRERKDLATAWSTSAPCVISFCGGGCEARKETKKRMSCDPPPCMPCDEDGYPKTARRRLRKLSDETVVDIDDGQCFKVKKTKNGKKRLVPLFEGSVDWKTASGFTAMCLLLSCLGEEGEYVVWDETTDAPMTEDEWTKKKYNGESRPVFFHRACGSKCTNTKLKALKRGGGIGCSRCSVQPWNARFQQFRDELPAGYELQTTEQTWIIHCTGSNYCPVIRCIAHDTLITTTCIYNARAGHMGCPQCHPTCNLWRDRYDEFVERTRERSFTLVTTREEWRRDCTNNTWCPKVRCKHGILVQNMHIMNILKDHEPSCAMCRSETQSAHTEYKKLRNRFAEFKDLCISRNVTLLTTETQWEEVACDEFKPLMRCNVHNTQVESTRAGSFIGGRFGCLSCQYKTEGKLHRWLQTTYPDAMVDTQPKGPVFMRETRFDFRLSFATGAVVLVELDGPQHFWPTSKWFSPEGCARDLAKEEWAFARSLSVVRVVQKHVWDELHDWKNWLETAINAAKNASDVGPGRLKNGVYTPDFPEYRSEQSAYVQLRCAK